MRTTVTLDPDVEKYIREACHRTRKSFKRVLNDALRQSLKPPTQKPPLLPPKAMGIAAGIDSRKLANFADEMDLEEHLRITRRTPST